MKLSQLLVKLQTENDKIFIKEFNAKKNLKGYKKIIDNNLFDIYQTGEINNMIVAGFKSVIVKHKRNSLYFEIYPNYTNLLFKYKIKLDKYNFPGLISNSKIARILIIPYLRETKKAQFLKRWRVIVITDKAQIYHNFPKREREIDGIEMYGDVSKFEESAIWDIPGRLYPSKNINCDETEEYLPYLPVECYEYHPKINQKSKFGNDGFDKYTYVKDANEYKKVSRFYFPSRTLNSNPFMFMGGYEMDYKMTLLGTYQSNKNIGVRTCVFASSDGGRNWFAKYEFADEGEYIFKQGEETWGNNFGNKINLSSFNSEFKGKAALWQRKFERESNKLFKFGKEIKIKSIKIDDTVVVETLEEHNLRTGNVIFFKGEDDINTEWNIIFNNQCTESCPGNNRFYKVKVINRYIIKIYEYVSNPLNNIACRHIHHINRVRDNWNWRSLS